MAYIPPHAVESPRNRLRLLGVILDEGQSAPAVAHGEWDGRHVILMRWNGSDQPGDNLGHPQSTGHPVWFVLPGFGGASTLGHLLERASEGDAAVNRRVLYAAIQHVLGLQTA